MSKFRRKQSYLDKLVEHSHQKSARESGIGLGSSVDAAHAEALSRGPSRQCLSVSSSRYAGVGVSSHRTSSVHRTVSFHPNSVQRLVSLQQVQPVLSADFLQASSSHHAAFTLQESEPPREQSDPDPSVLPIQKIASTPSLPQICIIVSAPEEAERKSVSFAALPTSQPQFEPELKHDYNVDAQAVRTSGSSVDMQFFDSGTYTPLTSQFLWNRDSAVDISWLQRTCSYLTATPSGSQYCLDRTYSYFNTLLCRINSKQSKCALYSDKPGCFSKLRAKVPHNVVAITFLVANLLFVVPAFALLLLGSQLLFRTDRISALFNLNQRGQIQGEGLGLLQTTAIVLFITGLITVGVSLMAYYGYFKRRPFLLWIYLWMLLVLGILQSVALVYVVFYSKSIRTTLKLELIENLQLHYDGNINSTNTFSLAMDAAQANIGCCGVEGYTDYYNTKWYKIVNKANASDKRPLGSTVNKENALGQRPGAKIKKFPLSCCKLRNPEILLPVGTVLSKDDLQLDKPDCPEREPSRDNLYTGFSCYERLKDRIEESAEQLFRLTCVIMTIEIICLILVRAVIQDMKRQLKREATIAENRALEEQETQLLLLLEELRNKQRLASEAPGSVPNVEKVDLMIKKLESRLSLISQSKSNVYLMTTVTEIPASSALHPSRSILIPPQWAGLRGKTSHVEFALPPSVAQNPDAHNARTSSSYFDTQRVFKQVGGKVSRVDFTMPLSDSRTEVVQMEQKPSSHVDAPQVHLQVPRGHER